MGWCEVFEKNSEVKRQHALFSRFNMQLKNNSQIKRREVGACGLDPGKTNPSANGNVHT